VEEIRRRFGKRAIHPANLLGDLKIPGIRSNEIIMPGVRK
jgi:DNA polymerase-4